MSYLILHPLALNHLQVCYKRSKKEDNFSKDSWGIGKSESGQHEFDISRKTLVEL